MKALTLFAIIGITISVFVIEFAEANPKMIGALLMGAALAKRPKMLPFPLPLPIPMKVEHKKYVPYKKPIPYYVHKHYEPPMYADKGYGGGYDGGYSGGGGGGDEGGYGGGY